MNTNRTLGSDYPVDPVHPVKNVSAFGPETEKEWKGLTMNRI
jgi:hypothetical protein